MIEVGAPPTLEWIYYIYDRKSTDFLDIAYDNRGLILALNRIEKLSPTKRVFEIVTTQEWMYNFLTYPSKELAEAARQYDIELAKERNNNPSMDEIIDKIKQLGA